MFYLVSTKLDKNKLTYDIIEEFDNLKEVYDYLYNHNYKKYIFSNNYNNTNHYYNKLFKNVSVWKEEDVEQILDEYIDQIFYLI